MATSEQTVLEELKGRTRATWAAGNYDAVVDGIWDVGAVVTGYAAIAPGEKVLDIACGTGNAAIRAAQAGGDVVGVDLTPEMFPAGRRRAQAAGVEIEWVEGDAEDLPFDGSDFDVVLSTFGVMFAPRHSVAADEIVRVLRPGGRVVLANWNPEGSVGDFFRTLAGFMPPPASIAEPPLLWGTEDHVRELFDGRLDLAFHHTHVPLTPKLDGASNGEAIDLYLDVFPPLVVARSRLQEKGQWSAAERDLRAAVAGMLSSAPSYVVVTGRKEPNF